MPQSIMKVYSPYSEKIIGSVPRVDWSSIDQALDTARQLHREYRCGLPLHQRVDILERMVVIMSQRRDDLALQAANEGGKPLMDSRVETDRAIDGIKLCIETIRMEQGQVIPMGGTAAATHRVAFTQREAIGPVVAVSAFNHPVNLIVHQMCAAIAAGCPVLVKAADDTPLSALSLVEIAHEAGLPAAWCQFVMPVDLTVAEKMVIDPRVAFFSFIGSARVGWMLRGKLAPGTRCALEHGGAAPLIVAADADIAAALSAVAKGGFYHAGQVCVSVQRVFAEASIANEFARQLAAVAEKLVVGDPAAEDTEVGPLIRPAEQQRVGAWVDEAVAAGAQVLSGHRLLNNNCYAPTVLFNPPHDSKVSTQEIFGPVVCVYSYEDLEQAIDQANALPYAFQAAVFTRSIDTAMTVYRKIDGSAVMVNDHTAFRVDGMPFAGVQQSGLGVGGIPHTIRDMRIDKMMVVHSAGL